MPRQKSQETPEVHGPQNYLEVPMVVYSAGRRVRVGIASVFKDGIAAHFDANPDDKFAKSIIRAITEGDVNALSIAPTPEHSPTLADYMRQGERL
jgi:hypothetical protein